MSKQSSSKEKYCGNCHHHSVYKYPDQIFCVFHFQRRENPIFATLDVCEHWKPDYQECFCVLEALRKHRG